MVAIALLVLPGALFLTGPPAADTAAAAATAEGAAIAGALVDERGRALPGLLVHLECDCLEKPRVVVAGVGGRFEVTGLPAGTYKISVRDGGELVEEARVVDGAARAEVLLTVPEPPYVASAGRLSYSGFSGVADVGRAQAELAAGGILIAAAFALVAGAAAEASGPACADAPDPCTAPRRREVSAALGVAGGLAVVAGTTLAVVGGVELRRARLQLAARPTGAALRLAF